MKIKRFDQINVIPFIDIMLVLLVIVLTTATFIAKGQIPLDLPTAKSTKNLPLKSIEISITKSAKFFWNKQEVSLEDISKKLKNLNRKSPIVIRSDKSAKFEDFIKIVDLLKSNSFESIAVETVK